LKTEQVLTKHYAIYLLGKIVPGIIGLISVPVFLHIFDRRVYGEFSLIYSTFLLFLSISTGWLTQGLVRFYSTFDEPEAFLQNIYRILFYTILLLLIPGIIILKYFNYTFDLICLLITAYFFASYNAIFIIEYQTKFLPKKIVISDAIRSFFFLAIPVILLYLNLLKTPLIILFSGVLCSFVVANLFLISTGSTKKTKFLSINFFHLTASVKKILALLWTYGWPLSLWFVFATLLNISDRYLISYYLDLSKVGEYSAVYDLIYKSLVFLLSPLLMALHPQVVKCFNEGHLKEASHILRRAIIFELGIFFVAIVVLTSLKELLVTGLLGFGAETKVTDLVIPIFIGSFLWQMAMLLHKPMELKKQTKQMLLAVLIALVANIAGNILLIPIYGSVAAAYTTILGSAIYILANYRSLISIFYSKSKYLVYEH